MMKFILVILTLIAVVLNSRCYGDTDDNSSNNSENSFNSDQKHPHGDGKQVIYFEEIKINGSEFIEKKVKVNEAILSEMFLNDEVKNRKVVVYSIAGPHRTGKSFFMDYALRYMYGHYRSVATKGKNFRVNPDWMGRNSTEPLRGFSWAKSSERVTEGIVFWSDIFLHDNAETGDKLAIVLIDTQGLFDGKTGMKENTFVFALTILLSSFTFLNLPKQLESDRLQYLNTVLQIYKQQLQDSDPALSEDESDKQLFSNLLFLIRDWVNVENYEYGLYGGESYMKNFFSNLRKSNTRDGVEISTNIKKAFENVYCYLMPLPGPKIQGITTITKPKTSRMRPLFGVKATTTTEAPAEPEIANIYDGNAIDMSEDFSDYLGELIAGIFGEGNLSPKRAGPDFIDATEFVNLIKEYVNMYNNFDLPKAYHYYEIASKLIQKKLMKIFSKKYEDYFGNAIQYTKFIYTLPSTACSVAHELSKEHVDEQTELGKQLHGSNTMKEKFIDNLSEHLDKIFEENREFFDCSDEIRFEK